MISGQVWPILLFKILLSSVVSSHENHYFGRYFDFFIFLNIFWHFIDSGGSVAWAVATSFNPRVVGSNSGPCFYFSELHCTYHYAFMNLTNGVNGPVVYSRKHFYSSNIKLSFTRISAADSGFFRGVKNQLVVICFFPKKYISANYFWFWIKQKRSIKRFKSLINRVHFFFMKIKHFFQRCLKLVGNHIFCNNVMRFIDWRINFYIWNLFEKLKNFFYDF